MYFYITMRLLRVKNAAIRLRLLETNVKKFELIIVFEMVATATAYLRRSGFVYRRCIRKVFWKFHSNAVS
jgi:hypothetical protein